MPISLGDFMQGEKLSWQKLAEPLKNGRTIAHREAFGGKRVLFFAKHWGWVPVRQLDKAIRRVEDINGKVITTARACSMGGETRIYTKGV